MAASSSSLLVVVSAAFFAAVFVAPAHAACCTNSQLQWPSWTPYCWKKRNSYGALGDGPGSNNSWAPSNVKVLPTGELQMNITRVAASPNANYACSEVTLSQSLGFGDYTFVVASDPSTLNIRHVGATFIYLDDYHELDFEHARWSDRRSNNSQFVVQVSSLGGIQSVVPPPPPPTHVNPLQPYDKAGAMYRFNASGGVVNRLRWTGTAALSQMTFETWSADDGTATRPLAAWTPTGGNTMPTPGQERVHLNFWVSDPVGAGSVVGTFTIRCFRFCPLAQLGSCSTPLGTRPVC